MKEKYPFIKCLHPKKIVNPYTHETLLVPCRNCEVCALQKSAMNTLKCKLECKSHRFNEFVTLTYNNFYVPQVQVIPATKSVVREYLPLFQELPDKVVTADTLDGFCDSYNYIMVDVSGRFSSDGMILGYGFMKDIDWFALRNKVGYGDRLNVLRYEDIQQFLKRIREKIHRLYGQKIRYYCVGEYGPEHYRPHWHLILSYDCPFLAQGIRQVIRSCWQYGRVDTGKSRGKCASYCAGYVNSSLSIPTILKCPQTQPKSYHSIRLGEEFLKVSKEEVYQSKNFGFVNQCINLDDKPTEFNLWRSFETRIFPRCKGFATKSDEECIETYRIEVNVSRIFGQNVNCISVARKLLGYILRRRSGYDYTSYVYDNPELLELLNYFCRSNKINLSTVSYSHIDKIKLLRSIYTELLCSRFFIREICKSYDYSVSVSNYMVIKEFFKFLDYQGLINQLKWQQDNLTDSTKFDDYKFVYTNIYYDINDIYENKYYRTMREAQLTNFERSQKHKKLNDKYNVRQDD